MVWRPEVKVNVWVEQAEPTVQVSVVTTPEAGQLSIPGAGAKSQSRPYHQAVATSAGVAVCVHTMVLHKAVCCTWVGFYKGLAPGSSRLLPQPYPRGCLGRDAGPPDRGLCPLS